jgi:hypothetical protein
MKGAWVLITTLVLAACQSLPVIQPAPAGSGKTACPSVFAQAPIRYIHAIEARAAGKTQAVMIGVTLLNPETKAIASAIVSAEGLSLFEAASVAGDIAVSRALPPFDAPDFAKNLMNDIELIFLAPRGALQAQGNLADGHVACRWHLEKGGWIDVSEDMERNIRIQRYSQSSKLTRTVTLTPKSGNAYAAIVLQASGLIDYTLIMTLIESEAVADEAKSESPVNKPSSGKAP